MLANTLISSGSERSSKLLKVWRRRFHTQLESKETANASLISCLTETKGGARQSEPIHERHAISDLAICECEPSQVRGKSSNGRRHQRGEGRDLNDALRAARGAGEERNGCLER